MGIKKTIGIIALFLVLAVIVNSVIIAIFVKKKDNSHYVELNRVKHLVSEYEKENNLAAEDLSVLISFAKAKGKKFEFGYVLALETSEFSDTAEFVNSESGNEEKVVSYFATEKSIYRVISERADDRSAKKMRATLFLTANSIIFIAAVICLAMHFYYQKRILKPLQKMVDIPAEIAKGNLVKELPEVKGKYFGNFNWGMNMLRDNLEETKAKNLQLERDKKVLLMSLSHDIKTPLNAISLYSKAISKGLYSGDKVISSAESIQTKVFEIEDYMKRIVNASNEDIIEFNVKREDVYLKDIFDRIEDYYRDKMNLRKIDFEIGKYNNKIINVDPERLIEVIQNLIENALKYGDGNKIWIEFEEQHHVKNVSTESEASEKDHSSFASGDVMIKICNTGCTLEKRELANIFESFYRGTNTGKQEGSGLGLYICRRLMHLMDGEIFADIVDDNVMCVTLEL
ncbi:MAG: HAMP domain-containing histidine kinase [Eubacterium sp.]|nr:HAMP domain-containing histidine kinase [Eubacterium sp.]